MQWRGERKVLWQCSQDGEYPQSLGPFLPRQEVSTWVTVIALKSNDGWYLGATWGSCQKPRNYFYNTLA